MKKLSAKRKSAVDRQKSYLDKFYTSEELPPKPEKLSSIDYQVMCRLYLCADNYGEGDTVKIYVGDILQDAHEMRTATTRVVNRLMSATDIPCLFTQKAILSWVQYDIKFCLGYDKQREYMDTGNCTIHKRQTVDFRQKKFF